MEAETRKWIQIAGNDSWHILGPDKTDDAGFTVLATLCGLTPRNFDLRTERPGHEASCENCLRILTKD
jgi:hypothetical protein